MVMLILKYKQRKTKMKKAIKTIAIILAVIAGFILLGKLEGERIEDVYYEYNHVKTVENFVK